MSDAPGATARASFFDAGGQIVIFVFSLAAGILLSRFLGPDGRGAYVLATSTAAMLLTDLGNLGLAVASQVMVAKDTTRLARLHTLIAVACLAVGGVLGGALVLLAEVVRARLFVGMEFTHLVILALGLPAVLYLHLWQGLMIGLGKVRHRTTFETLFNIAQSISVAVLVLAAFLVLRREPVTELVVAYFALHVLAVPLMVRALGWPAWQMPDAATVREALAFGRWVWIGNLGSALVQRADQYLVNGILGTATFGVYTLSTSLAGRSSIGANALVRSMSARVASAPAEDAARLCARGFRQLLLFGLAVWLVGCAVAPLIPLVYGEDFAKAALLFPIVLGGAAFLNACRVLALYFTGNLARPEIPLAVNWAVVPVQIAASWWLTSRFGAFGAAFGVLGGYALICAAFMGLFLRMAPGARLSWLVRPQSEDLDAWRAALRRGR